MVVEAVRDQGPLAKMSTPLASARFRSGATRAERAKDTFVVLGLVAVGVGLPVLLGAVSGALTIPHNDDFNYRRVALGLYQTGHVELTGWTVMSLIGQLVTVEPVLWVAGGASWAFAAATALFAVLAILAGYVILRRVLSVLPAAFAALGLLFFPGFLLNTTSFMTDVPALAGEMVCLAFGATALSKSGWSRGRWLTASLAAGCFAFSIREFALAAPVAILIVAAVGDGSHFRRYCLAGIVVVAICGAIYYLTANLPGQGSATLLADPPLSSYSVDRVRRAAATLALVLSPALIVAAVNWSNRWSAVGAVVGLVAGLLVYSAEIVRLATTGTVSRLLVGNLLEPDGAPGGFGVLAGDRPLLFTPPLWDIMNVAALVAVIGALAIAGSGIGSWLRRVGLDRERLAVWLGSTAGLLAIFALLYGAGLIAFGLVASMFDRYLWPLVVPLSALLLKPSRFVERAAIRRVASGLATMLMTTLAATSIALLLNADAFGAARWRMGELAVSRGLARETVDAGMEWVGYHARGLATVGASPTRTEMWYDAWWPSFHLCAMVSSSLLEIPDFRLEHADIDAYRLLLFDGPEEGLYLYRVAGPGCP
jgi:hypothetical protein